MIFISVAAFNEPYLFHTVQDAFNKAAHPENLIFAVVDQHMEHRAAELKQILMPSRLRYVHIHPAESRGVCWARSIAFSLYQGEDYLMQIDSHMLFEPGWDSLLIEQLRDLGTRSKKPIISVYPHGFVFENDLPIVKKVINPKTTLVLRPHPETDLSPTNATLRFRAVNITTRKPVIGCHVAGGFLFTRGTFVNQVPYDPFLYFNGEEQSLALRAFTRGWDIFHHPEVPIYHLYKPPKTPNESHHWHVDWEKQRDFSAAVLRKKGRERVMDLLYQRRDLGVFGLGSERTLADYTKISGVDYINKTIDRDFKVKVQ